MDVSTAVETTARIEAERSFRRLFQASPAPYLILAPDSPCFTIKEVNDAYLAATMRTREDLVGRCVFDAFPDNPDDPTIQGVSRLRSSLEHVLATREPNQLTGLKYDIARPDGSFEERWWSPINSPVLDERGEVEAIIHNANDVTEQRRAQAALRESEERYRQIVEGADDFAIVTLDAHGVITTWNTGAERMTGFSESEALGRSGEIFFTPEDREAGAPDHEMARALSDGRVVNERWHMRQDGSRFWGSGLMMQLNGHGGGFLKMFRDRTAEHEAEAAMRQSEARLAFLDRLGAETAPLADADAVLATTTRLMGEHLNLSVCAYADMDEDEDGFTIRGDWAAAGSTSIVGHYSLADFGKLAVKNLSAGLPLVINDNLREIAPEEAATFQAIGIAATICMPLVKEGRLTALMAIHDRVPRQWTEAELSLLREVTARSWAHVERVAAIAELRASEERYRTLFDSIESGFCVVEVDLDAPGDRIDYRVIEANPAFYRHTGFPETITNHWLREAAPALEEHWYAAYGRVARTGLPERFEQGSDFLDRWFDVFAFRTGAPDERRVGILFSDITARRQAEEQLRESEARLRAVIDAAPVGLVFADASGRITGANARVEEIIAAPITRSEDVGSYGSDYVAFHADGRRVESAEYPLAQVVGGASERAELEVQVQLTGGARRWVRYIATPMKDEEGRRIGAVVASLNIDQEKRFAESLAREVERAVAELETAQEALRQSQKMEAMGQLTGGVAHDFNNLLTPIIGSLDMLQRRGSASDREQRLIDGALQSAEKAKTLVQRLLAFARRQPLQAQAVDVPKLVGDMAELVASTSGPHIKVKVDADQDLPSARADPNQLEMAILNLAVNARDAMPDGGLLTISAKLDQVGDGHRSRLPRGRYVRLSVSDTGIGMDQATLARAVEPFFSTKGIGRGTGLGLSMVEGLAAQLGGALAIDSRVGLGTAIHLWLPVTDADATIDQEAVHVERLASVGTALLVDDEELVRASTAEMLADIGYAVVEAASGEEALRLVDSGLDFDLLVTDHLMPGLKGTELAATLLQRFPRILALVISGYADSDDITPDLPRLSKPFRQAELASALAELRSRAEVASPQEPG